jgi:hypothetical protein
MSKFSTFVLAWAAAVLTFDTAASVTSLLTRVPYMWFTLGSAVIYLTASYKGAPRFGLRMAVAAALLVSLIDATLGWGLSWLIGPGQVEDPEIPFGAALVIGATGSLVFGATTGLLGGWVGLKRSAQPVPES